MQANPDIGLNEASMNDLAVDTSVKEQADTDRNQMSLCLFHPDSLLPIGPMLHPDDLEEFHPIYDTDFVLLTKSGRSKLHKNRLSQLQHIWQSLDTIGLAQPLRKSSNTKVVPDDSSSLSESKPLDLEKLVFGRRSNKKATHATSTEEQGLNLAKLVFG
jgi:hypothetical protein